MQPTHLMEAGGPPRMLRPKGPDRRGRGMTADCGCDKPGFPLFTSQPYRDVAIFQIQPWSETADIRNGTPAIRTVRPQKGRVKIQPILGAHRDPLVNQALKGPVAGNPTLLCVFNDSLTTHCPHTWVAEEG